MYYLKFKTIMNKLATNIIILFMLFISFTVGTLSLLSTAVFDNKKVETIIYEPENILLLLLLTIILVSILFIIYKSIRFDEKTVKKIKIFLFFYTIILGIIWLSLTQSLPFADGELVDKATSDFTMRNYQLLEKGQYFDKFPFQLNLVFIFDLIYKIVGYHNYMVLQILNVIALAGTYYYLNETIGLLFDNKRYQSMFLILCILCLPALLYCSFIYSTMYGLFLSTLAFYYGLLFVRKRKLSYFLIIIPAMCIAVMLKSNYLITLLALVCILVMDFINKRKFYSLILIILLVIIQGIPSKLVQNYYRTTTHQDISKGIPTIAWVAMGMHEGEKASGWYNSYMFKAYKEANYDTERTKEICKDGIKKRIHFFVKNPKEMISFYGRKINSQWNEPTYESLWVSEHRKGMHAISLIKPVKSLYFGVLNKIYLEYTNVYQFIIFIATFIGIWLNRKKFSYEQLSIAVIIIGGFLFHLLWEGNSKYILPYFVLLLPYAAIGLSDIFQRLLSLNLFKKKER